MAVLGPYIISERSDVFLKEKAYFDERSNASEKIVSETTLPLLFSDF